MGEGIGAPEVAEVAHGGVGGAARLRGRTRFRLHEPDRRGEEELSEVAHRDDLLEEAAPLPFRTAEEEPQGDL